MAITLTSPADSLDTDGVLRMNTNTSIRYTAALLLGVIIGISGMYAFTTWHQRSTPEDCILSHVKGGMNRDAVIELTEACNSKYALDSHAQATATLTATTPSWGANDPVAKPIDPKDNDGWKAYLGDLVQKNLQGMTASQPFAYLVDAADTDDAKVNNERQLANLTDTVSRGGLPGNLLAFTGADSAKTADLVEAAFRDAKPGSFNDVIVLFIGDKADEQRVNAAIKPTGATIRFVTM